MTSVERMWEAVGDT